MCKIQMGHEVRTVGESHWYKKKEIKQDVFYEERTYIVKETYRVLHVYFLIFHAKLQMLNYRGAPKIPHDPKPKEGRKQRSFLPRNRGHTLAKNKKRDLRVMLP